MLVHCGSCGALITYIALARHEFRDRSGWGEPFRVLRFVAGWRPDVRGVWILPVRALSRLEHGQSPHLRGEPYIEGEMGALPSEPSRLPVRAQCPDCRAEQELDPVTLDVDPEGSFGLPLGDHHILAPE
jgi:hypothetical protein